MAVLLLVSLLTIQICYGQDQQLPTQQLTLPPAQPQLYLQTPQTGTGQPGSMVDLFRMAATSLSQTLINLLNYKAQWLNQLASSIPPAQTTPAQGVLQSTFPGVQTPAGSLLQPMSSASAGNLLTSGVVGLPNTGIPAPTYQQPSAAPVQSTQLQSANPIASPPQAQLPAAQGAPLTGVNPLATPPQAQLPAAQGTPVTGVNPLATPPQAAAQGTTLPGVNPIATPPQAQLPPAQGTPLTGVNPIATPPQAQIPAAQGTSLPGVNPIATPPEAQLPPAQEGTFDRN